MYGNIRRLLANCHSPDTRVMVRKDELEELLSKADELDAIAEANRVAIADAMHAAYDADL